MTAQDDTQAAEDLNYGGLYRCAAKIVFSCVRLKIQISRHTFRFSRVGYVKIREGFLLE